MYLDFMLVQQRVVYIVNSEIQLMIRNPTVRIGAHSHWISCSILNASANSIISHQVMNQNESKQVGY